MRTSLRTRTVIGLVMATTVAVLPLAAGTTSEAATSISDSSSGEHVDPSGITVVDQAMPAGAPLPEGAAQQLAAAYRASREHPDLLAYPWFDRSSGEVVIDAEAGSDSVVQPLLRGAAAAGVPARVRTTSVARSDLDVLKDSLIGLTDAQAPHADLIWQTAADPGRDRVLVTVTRLDDGLLSWLAAHYDPARLAVTVNAAQPSLMSRNWDQSPFWGGAVISVPNSKTCTSGIPWVTGTTSQMLIAGHCIPNGGTVSTAAESMGTVASGTAENWAPGIGTVYFSGQSTYRGDLALITIYSGKSSQNRIYRGGTTSSSYGSVTAMWSRETVPYDQFCSGGSQTGEMCGWSVGSVDVNVRYTSGETARNMVAASKQGWCILGGDSGSPTYTVSSSGTIAVKGIISGGGGGGSDNYGGAFDMCETWYTDVWDAYYSLPGVPRTS